MSQTKSSFALFLVSLLLGCIIGPAPSVGADKKPFIDKFDNITQIASTVPANGDVNPYGVAVVRRSVGSLVKGNILVSNFNNSSNLQGTGTTIVQVTPDGNTSVFAQIDAKTAPACPGGIGLTTALVALRSGWVIVGSLPTADGTSATAQAGCLLVLNSNGQPVESIHGDPINGPWDMTAFEQDHWAALFVTNVLNGTVQANGNVVNQGTVVRIILSVPEKENDNENENENENGNGNGNGHGKEKKKEASTGDSPIPEVLSETVIGSGFSEKTDPAALVIGPTGVGLGHDGTLYVADTVNNAIRAIPNALFRNTSAGTGNTVSSGGALNGPLGLAIAPNGDIVTVNAGDGNMVETTPEGTQVAVKLVDTTGTGAGTLFGLAIVPNHQGVYFVNDGNNTLNLLH